MEVIYKAELNTKYNQWRVIEYIDGEFNNDREYSSKDLAEKQANGLNTIVKKNNINYSLFD